MNPDIDIHRILTTQNDLRNISQICQMIDYVNAGGFFTQVDLIRYVALNKARSNPPLIALTEFPDGILAAHDGHHRLTAIYLSGRRLLRGDEYILKRYAYHDYTEINLASGWFTPFDPITEVRLCDFMAYKKEVRRLMVESPGEVLNYIISNSDLYSAPRDINFIPELADKIQTRLNCSVDQGSGFCLASRW